MAAEQNKPRIFYGYIVVGLAVAILAMVFGINFSFGVFFNPLVSEFGWHRSVTSVAYALMNLVGGFIGIFGGRISDRLGVKVVCLGCGISMSIGLFLMSAVNDLWQVYLLYGVLIGAGLSSSWISLNSSVARWFVVRRGLMISIVTVGNGLGTITVPYLAGWLIPEYGWRMTYLVIGAMTFVVIIAASLFLKHDPSEMGLNPYGSTGPVPKVPAAKLGLGYVKNIVFSRNFLLLSGVYFLYGVSMHTIMVHIVPHAVGIGVEPIAAAAVISLIGAINIGGRLIMGASSERLGVKKSLWIALGTIAVADIWLLLTHDLWGLYIFAVLFGFAYGGLMAYMGFVPAELFGLASLGTILGVIAFIFCGGAAVGPVLSGYIFDVTGSYQIAFMVAAMASILACVLTFFIKIRQSSGEVKDLKR